MIRYNDINQFRNLIKEIQEHQDFAGKDENKKPIFIHTCDYPILSFEGTVKLNGTNAAIVKYKNGEYKFQSRERELSLDFDNDNFMKEMSNKDYQKLFDKIQFNDYTVFFGEWCGKGIQKGMAINQLPRMFVIFDINIDGQYQDIKDYSFIQDNENGIYNIMQFKTFNITIDFNNPDKSIDELTRYTKEVANECPVGKYFNVSGFGEGIVWKCYNGEMIYVFKTKDEKHKVSKEKETVTIEPEVIESINNFINYAVTENRLKQGLDKLIEMGKAISMESTGDYMKWVVNDILREEKDVIEKNNLNFKLLKQQLSKSVKTFFWNYLKNEI